MKREKDKQKMKDSELKLNDQFMNQFDSILYQPETPMTPVSQAHLVTIGGPGAAEDRKSRRKRRRELMQALLEQQRLQEEAAAATS